MAADWTRGNGRRLLALTVDHGLNPDSAGWTAFAEAAARDAGADWRGLAWTGDKPAAGLPAAARAARHRLIAEAAREAGARVVLFAHTADDLLEAETMRAEGSTVGRPREWSPSPAWPEGRGLMLLRPMLGARRGDIRHWLAGQGADWIEDPANVDVRFARARARAALDAVDMDRSQPRPSPGALPSMFGDGVFAVRRDVGLRVLAATLVCAGGGDRPPRGPRLIRLRDRLAAGEDFSAVLAGARIEAVGDELLIMREAGELRRRRPPPLPLTPGVEAVWDGRWALTVAEPGWSVVPAAGLRARLSPADQERLAALPAATRGAMPVLIRNGPDAPVLAGSGQGAVSLAETRLRLALDTTPHEGALE